MPGKEICQCVTQNARYDGFSNRIEGKGELGREGEREGEGRGIEKFIEKRRCVLSAAMVSLISALRSVETDLCERRRAARRLSCCEGARPEKCTWPQLSKSRRRKARCPRTELSPLGTIDGLSPDVTALATGCCSSSFMMFAASFIETR